MPKLDGCDRCHFYSHSPYLVCAIHPGGVSGVECLNFRANLQRAEDEALAFYAPWQPEGASYYGDDLVLEPVQRLTLEQRLELLDSHPLFTGRCPECEIPIVQTDPPRVHWDCEHCDWKDDAV